MVDIYWNHQPQKAMNHLMRSDINPHEFVGPVCGIRPRKKVQLNPRCQPAIGQPATGKFTWYDKHMRKNPCSITSLLNIYKKKHMGVWLIHRSFAIIYLWKTRFCAVNSPLGAPTDRPSAHPRGPEGPHSCPSCPSSAVSRDSRDPPEFQSWDAHGRWTGLYCCVTIGVTIPEDPCMEYLPTLTPKVI